MTAESPNETTAKSLTQSARSDSFLNIIDAQITRSAIGAKLRVLATIGGKSVWQMRVVSANGGYMSATSLEAAFGLGDATRIEAVRNRPGIVSGVFLLGYAVSRAAIEFFREPDANIGFLFNAVTMGQILCAPMALGGLFLLFLALHRDSRLSAGKQV